MVELPRSFPPPPRNPVNAHLHDAPFSQQARVGSGLSTVSRLPHSSSPPLLLPSSPSFSLLLSPTSPLTPVLSRLSPRLLLSLPPPLAQEQRVPTASKCPLHPAGSFPSTSALCRPSYSDPKIPLSLTGLPSMMPNGPPRIS